MNEINFELSFSELINSVSMDLLYPSESDEKIELVDFGCNLTLPIDEKSFKSVINAKSKDKFEICDVQEFYSSVAIPQDWWTEYETVRMRKFLILKDILSNKLSDLVYIRIGRVEINAYILGKDKFDGTIKGIKTLIVET
ncbi:MAG: nuclease A inhibitor family protein [Spirosomaceae bacterium]|jgi:hypothetical protein|nr:nuclease A inhibitor family protein [Spirosomataceae bacterium]